jgi:hypothetical protein
LLIGQRRCMGTTGKKPHHRFLTNLPANKMV